MSHDHLDASLPSAERADLLAGQMTTAEKCWQLTAVPAWWMSLADGSDPDGLDELLTRAPGHVSNFAVDDPARLAEIVGRIQRNAVERTRLGIPILLHAEALNGFMAGGHAVFPTAIGLAATWSPDLVEEMAEVIRRQMHRTGIRQALSPNMDVALDPRWGRVHETYGEDPCLCAAFSVAYTRGLQGEDLTRGVVATAKHFLGYGFPQGGLNLARVELGRRVLRDVFAMPFEAAIHHAGLRSVMNSYAELDAVPVAASREVLTDFLRAELGFDGFVTSDYMTLDHMVGRQRVARDAAQAGALALRAGLDVENPVPNGYGDTLAEQVESGAVDRQYLDVSVRRVLRAKFELGLFENPYPQEHIDVRAVAAEGRELTVELARRHVVLLENDGLLPLAGDRLRLAVVGPHAHAVGLQFPTYTFPAFREMTTFMSSGGLGNMVGVDPGMSAWNDAVFPPEPNNALVRRVHDARSLTDALRGQGAEVVSVRGSTLTTELGEEELARAVAAARQADVTVLALGGASLWFNGERTEGEASDSADISLPAAQVRLAEAVLGTGKPVVLVLFQGRAYVLPESLRAARAVVVASYGGPAGPAAVAEVLFGVVNPSGKLPYSIPAHPGQIPVYHHQLAGSGQRMSLPPGRDNLYLDSPAAPAWVFGHGLSYTTFALAALHHDEEIESDGAGRIAVTVANTGARDGATVVQLYARVNSIGVTRPAQQLLGFARVHLAAGQSQRVTFDVAAAQLGYTNLNRDFAVEPSVVEFFVGFDSEDRRLTGEFQVVGPARVLTSAERAYLCETEIKDV